MHKKLFKFALLFILFLLIKGIICYAGDIKITGIIKDVQGITLQGASIIFTNGATEYKTTSTTDGTYIISIPYTGIEENNSDINLYSNYPNPFSDKTVIPVYLRKTGSMLFSIYNLVGQKIYENSYGMVPAGAFYLEWDGYGQNGSSVQNGLYFYTIVFNGKRYNGKMLKTYNSQDYNGTKIIESQSQLKSFKTNNSLEFYSEINKIGYNTIHRLKINFTKDTTINFTLTPFKDIPFKTSGNYLTCWDYKETVYKPLFIKGINLGSGTPGYWPGEINSSITPDQYERWIKRMRDAGFNTLRVYTLHPPVFYQKLAEYNEANPNNPIYLFQGIWLAEDEYTNDSIAFDLHNKTAGFDNEILDVIDCIHGNRSIAQRVGKAFGDYKIDISRWVIGYIAGREVYGNEVNYTNNHYSTEKAYSGLALSASGVNPSEAWLTERLDKLITYERNIYHNERPVSFSNWPTLDPISHTGEVSKIEDMASIDLNNIDVSKAPAGYFASYHAYPYYPNFISKDTAYLHEKDDVGLNSYMAYLKALKSHYSNVPVIIAEFGASTSLGIARYAQNGIHHGGLTEAQQGAADVRMLHNIHDSNCGGGMMFLWFDTWFKSIWITEPFESKGFSFGPITYDTRQLWHNRCSPEQNFGLISFEPLEQHVYNKYHLDNTNSFIDEISAVKDFQYFYVDIALKEVINLQDTLWVAFDTYRQDLGESVLPNKTSIINRSEFLLQIPFNKDSAYLFVTQKYNLYGLSNNFMFADTALQKFKSMPTNGEPWLLERWRNSLTESQDIGKISMRNINELSWVNAQDNDGIIRNTRKVRIRIPWSLLYVSDPTRLEVVDGFKYKYGEYMPTRAITDGLAISVCKGNKVVNTITRYSWQSSLEIPKTIEREKASIPAIEKGLLEIKDIP